MYNIQVNISHILKDVVFNCLISLFSVSTPLGVNSSFYGIDMLESTKQINLISCSKKYNVT